MPVKLRLSRQGRKKAPFYHIVVADSRAPRDGRYIERIGSYNPVTNPATIEINFDSALEWLQKGAQPTDTVRAILSYKGVMLKKHLLTGVRKGALTEEQAEEKFQAWLKEKDAKIQSKVEQIAKDLREDKTERSKSEAKVREAKAELVAKKRAAEAEKEAEAAATTEEETAEAAPEEPVAGQPATEEPAPEQ